MKNIAAKALMITGGLLAFTNVAHADPIVAKTAAYGYDSYKCEELIQLDEDKVGSIIYYIRGHYDAKRNVWADYEPSKEQRVFKENFYVPVEKVKEFCQKNPKSTVVEALTTYNH